MAKNEGFVGARIKKETDELLDKVVAALNTDRSKYLVNVLETSLKKDSKKINIPTE